MTGADGRDPQVEGDIQHLLAEDADIAELGIEAISDGDVVVLRGQVTTADRRDRIVARVAEAVPGRRVRSEITVPSAAAPDGPEDPR
jgi:hypothetical protein